MGLKENIVHEALRLFSLQGFLNTSIDDILTRTNSSKGGLYNHFKSKDDLFQAVLSEARKMWRHRVLAGLDGLDRPLDQVRRILVNYRDRYLMDSENIPGGCVFVTLSVELDDQRPDLAAAVNEGFTRFKAMLRRLLDQARQAGELKAEADAGSLSEMLFAGMLGASVLFGMNKSARDLKRAIDPLLNYLDDLSA